MKKENLVRWIVLFELTRFLRAAMSSVSCCMGIGEQYAVVHTKINSSCLCLSMPQIVLILYELKLRLIQLKLNIICT